MKKVITAVICVAVGGAIFAGGSTAGAATC